MATLVFTAIGAQFGGSLLGGAIGAGLGAAVGRAVGGSVGRVVDQRLFGGGAKSNSNGSKPVELMRLTTAHHGAPVGEYWGRNRVAGQIIWSGGFCAKKTKKGYKYFASFALAIGKGEVHRIGRVWEQNTKVVLPDGKWRLYPGTENQRPDPLIASELGEENTPAYRGVAYVVFEDIDLTPYYNRIPSFEFEVFRHPKNSKNEYKEIIKSVAMIPGSGEYVYASRAVEMTKAHGQSQYANKARARSPSDFLGSLEDLQADLPNCRSVSLITCWFGDDLRVDRCQLTPRVEQNQSDGDQKWNVSGIGRTAAETVTQIDGSPVYGGTPDDQSVVQAIKAMRQRRLDVMFYPFILMDIPANNTKPNPLYGGYQPANPWRGRITLADQGFVGTQFSELPVNRFLGRAEVSDFVVQNGEVGYLGAEEWSYRRFILHYAHLCKLAGGVSEFLIGSELRGLTHIRADGDKFPFVDGLVNLARDVKQILGAQTKVGYAADWSEYFGYAPPDGMGSLYFHLDPLWASDDIDFIGIDNYMPISDWRPFSGHKDSLFGSVYSLDYLETNVEGGEGFDWYYESDKARDEQIRKPIEDWHGEPWVWRYKDIRNWWSNRHHNRVDGQRVATPTAWEPQSKPIYFTEFGAAATDLSTNQPNKFLDPKSSESSLPYYSRGESDPYIQLQYTTAISNYWQNQEHNPISTHYRKPMLDTEKFFCWCWDARPWPEFPMRDDLWSDAENFRTGHWINGRVNASRLSNVVEDICEPLGTNMIDTSRLYGQITGVAFHGDESVGEKLTALMQAYQFDVFYKQRKLHFVSRGYNQPKRIDEQYLVAGENHQTWKILSGEKENVSARFELQYVSGEKDYETDVVVSSDLNAATNDKSLMSSNFTFGSDEARSLAEIYHRQSRKGAESISFQIADEYSLEIGDTIHLNAASDNVYMVDRINRGAVLEVEAFAIEDEKRPIGLSSPKQVTQENAPIVPWVEWIDMPNTIKNAVHIYSSHRQWPGEVVFSTSDPNSGEELVTRSLVQPSCMGSTKSPLHVAQPDRLQNASIAVEFVNDNFRGTPYKNCPFPIFALQSDVDWEIIGARTYTKMSRSNYELLGLYRGLFGTKIGDHNAGAKIISLNSDHIEIAGADFEGVARADFEYGPASANGNIIKTTTIGSPKTAKTPLSPTNLHVSDGIARWTPRLRGDFDLWGDEELQDVLSYRVIIFQNETKVFETQTSENHIAISDYEGVQNAQISIQSIDAQGQLSDAITEAIK